MSWLITAFEPFGGAQTNSSQIILAALENELKKNNQYQHLSENFHFYAKLPVDFANAWPKLLNEINRHRSLTGILALGQAEGRSKISLERIALNWIDAKIPDNQGVQIEQKKIDTDGPELRWSKIPWEQLPSSPEWERSYSAGTYLCKFILFQLLQWCETNKKLGGFVHIPLLTSQNETIFSKNISKMNPLAATESMLKILEFLKTSCQKRD